MGLFMPHIFFASVDGINHPLLVITNAPKDKVAGQAVTNPIGARVEGRKIHMPE
jgi:hypothetical protein